MENYDVQIYGKEVLLPKIYALATSTEGRKDVRLKTAQELIHEQAKDSYCRQASSTLGFLGLTYNHDRNGFSRQTEPIDRSV